MSTTKSVHRSLVSLDLPKKVPALISFAISVVTAMTGNASFPTPAVAFAAGVTTAAAAWAPRGASVVHVPVHEPLPLGSGVFPALLFSPVMRVRTAARCSRTAASGPYAMPWRTPHT